MELAEALPPHLQGRLRATRLHKRADLPKVWLSTISFICFVLYSIFSDEIPMLF
jgi:hypothetical protein